MNRKDYPADWPEELIDSLERQPGWKPYYVPATIPGLDTIHTVMLERWDCQHLSLLHAFHVLLWHEGDSPYGDSHEVRSALRGIHDAMMRQMDDLEHIEHFIRETWDKANLVGAPDPDGDAETSNVITLPSQT
jgi:hypothetical protein